MISTTLQRIIDERISFLKEQINQENKPEVNKTFQLQMDVIRSVDDIEKVESIMSQKKTLLKNSKDVHESDRLFTELDAAEWLQRQIAVYAVVDDIRKESCGLDMMTAKNMNLLSMKSPSYYKCCKCNTKQADYYVLTGNRKAPCEMISLCDACYDSQSHQRRTRI